MQTIKTKPYFMTARNTLLAAFAMAGVWIAFKHFYPYADFFTDSYSYIHAAAQKDIVDYRPIGYPVFLRLVHAVSPSDTFLVTLQYAGVQLSSLALYARLRRWCRLTAGAQRLILIFLVLNPVIPYTCNYVSSDALFIALSLLWFNVLIGVILRPSWKLLGWQLLLLALIFNIRYVALYYPAVAAISFVLTRKDLRFKMAGIGASLAVVAIGIVWIKAVTRQQTGAPVFSAFSGWQIANNALHIYPYIPVDTVGLPSAESQELADSVRSYFARVGPAAKNPPSVTTAYMWRRDLPLHRYMAAYERRHSLSYFESWNRVGVVFTEYGYYLIRTHPLAYTRYYIWESAKSYFYPALESYTVYNEGRLEVDPVARDWFNYADTRVRVSSAAFQGELLAFLPLVYIVLNLVFIATACLFMSVRELRQRYPEFTLCFGLVSAYLLANAAFGICASPAVLRYQVLPVLLLFIFFVCAASLINRGGCDRLSAR